MAVGENNGLGSISASVFVDKVKSHFSGNLDWVTKTTSDKWIYSEHNVTTTGTVDMITTGEMFMGSSTTAAAGDKIQWIAIKHTETSDGATTTTESILITPTAATPAFNGGTATAGILIEPGELFVAKFPLTTIADLHGITCNVNPTTGGLTAGVGNVRVHIAALLKDVG